MAKEYMDEMGEIQVDECLSSLSGASDKDSFGRCVLTTPSLMPNYQLFNSCLDKSRVQLQIIITLRHGVRPLSVGSRKIRTKICQKNTIPSKWKRK